MLKTRTYVAAAVALALAVLPPAVANAQTADEAFDAVHELVHHWQDGETTAEEALAEIEELVHSVPASERTGMLSAIDEVVHHAEDGEVEPEAAMAEIEAIVHGEGGASHGDGVASGAGPSPATTGNAGLLAPAGIGGLEAALALLAAAVVLGVGRTLTGAATRR